MAGHLLMERDRGDGSLNIYLSNREEPVGFIGRTSNGRWRGSLKLYGQNGRITLDTEQAVVNELNRWAAEGMPSQKELNEISLAASRDYVRRLTET